MLRVLLWHRCDGLRLVDVVHLEVQKAYIYLKFRHH